MSTLEDKKNKGIIQLKLIVHSRKHGYRIGGVVVTCQMHWIASKKVQNTSIHLDDFFVKIYKYIEFIINK